MENRALLGLHNPRDEAVTCMHLEDKGYSIAKARTLDEMLDSVRGEEYNLYVMDINLGVSGGRDITPAVRVYELVRERVESGKARFIAVSWDSDTVALGKEKGIPAIVKDDLFEYIEQLE